MSRRLASRIGRWAEGSAILLRVFTLLKLHSEVIPGVDSIDLALLFKREGSKSSVASNFIQLFQHGRDVLKDDWLKILQGGVPSRLMSIVLLDPEG